MRSQTVMVCGSAIGVAFVLWYPRISILIACVLVWWTTRPLDDTGCDGTSAKKPTLHRAAADPVTINHHEHSAARVRVDCAGDPPTYVGGDIHQYNDTTGAVRACEEDPRLSALRHLATRQRMDSELRTRVPSRVEYVKLCIRGGLPLTDTPRVPNGCTYRG